MPADCSVIIVSYNTRLLLQQCLESVRASEGGLAVEIIVVDNGSRDGSPDMVRELFPEVKLIARGENEGFARAVNHGLRVSEGNTILLLNSDAMLQGQALETMLRFLRDHPAVGVVGSRIRNPDGTLQPSVRRFPTVWNVLAHASGLERLIRSSGWLAPYFVDPSETSEAREVDWLSGACLLLRREAVEKVGLFDERFFLYNEEMDWCFRARKAGMRIWLLPQAETVHLGGESSLRVDASRVVERSLSTELWKGMCYYMEKHHGPHRSAALRAGLCALSLVKLWKWGIIGTFVSDPSRRAEAQRRTGVLKETMRFCLSGLPSSSGGPATPSRLRLCPFPPGPPRTEVSAGTGRKTLNVIYFLGDDWDVWHRTGLMGQLATHCERFLGVEKPLSLDGLLHDPKGLLSWLQHGPLRRRDANLYLFKPLLPASSGLSFVLPILRPLNRVFLGIQLKSLTNRLGIAGPVAAIFSRPQQGLVMDALPRMVWCYECYDAYHLHPGQSERSSQRFLAEEEKILRRVDVVIASSKALWREKSRTNRRCFLVPNAWDGRGEGERGHPPVRLAMRAPRIGYVGMVNEIVDVDLIELLCRAHPEWSVVIVGSLNSAHREFNASVARRWRDLPNLHYLGRQHPACLFDYVRAFDVCLMPFVRCDYTDYVLPNKLFMYLASGKPVVSTDLPEVREYADVVSIARTASEFLSDVEQAVSERGDQDAMERRTRVARQNSWSARGEMLATILEQVLTRN